MIDDLTSWIPDPKDYDKRKGSGALLRRALGLIKNSPGNPIHDELGLIGYELENVILVAKKEPYGYIVSCHKIEIFDKAKEEGKAIVMFIARGEAFYQFDPEEIWNSDYYLNRKDNQQMINFNIKLGRRMNGSD